MTDKEVKQHVQDALDWEPSIDASDIGVSVDESVVTLRGAVGARFLKRVIDQRIKLPISARWREGAHFHVRVRSGEVTVDVTSAELAAA